MNITRANIKRQIDAEDTELARLKEVKEYLYNNLCATQAEQDAIFDILAQIADRRESRRKDLLERYTFSM